MAQINTLVNAARAVVQTTGSAVGVSAANANLVAVAGALSGMQLSGYEVVNPQMFVSVPDPVDALDALVSMASDISHVIPSPFQYEGFDPNIAAGLVGPDATFNFQDPFFAEIISQTAPDSESSWGGLLLESNSLYDPSHPDGGGMGPEAPIHHDPAAGSQDTSVILADTAQNNNSNGVDSSISHVQSAISQAANTAAANINYASSLSNYGYGSSYGYLVEPNGFVYHSSGSGDVIEGSAFADTLFGSSSGGDTLSGGAGNDTYAIYASTTQIVELAGGGAHDTAYIGVDNYQGTSGIERIVALNTQSYADHAAVSGPYIAGLDSGWHLYGSTDAQTLIGSYGADILNGGGGADLLIGGAGDDVYSYTGSETIIEDANQGHDIVQTSANLSLANNVEVGLALSTAGDVNITGNEQDNLLIGNGAANNLSGGFGADTLIGNGGDDVYTGGAGADTFILNSQDSYMGEITDFHSGQDHLALIHADPTVTLSMAPSDGFTGVAGQLLVTDGGLQVDWNGDALFDSVLLINEAPVLSDFTVIDPNHIPQF
ncbi:hypothetical protein NHB34_01845 [Polynucleobacter sp. MWH-UH19D]|uniref:calcium-binding protein n=1 Tax=Polynucleobacter sp. MWH-UH19D TaxID=1855610 RepID=UPI003364F2E7